MCVGGKQPIVSGQRGGGRAGVSEGGLLRCALATSRIEQRGDARVTLKSGMVIVHAEVADDEPQSHNTFI